MTFENIKNMDLREKSIDYCVEVMNAIKLQKEGYKECGIPVPDLFDQKIEEIKIEVQEKYKMKLQYELKKALARKEALQSKEERRLKVEEEIKTLQESIEKIS